jgi:hypothetical protein
MLEQKQESLVMLLEQQSRVRALSILGGVFITSAVAAAQISYGTPIAYVAGDDPHGAVLADFDGDGDVDIAVTVHNPARLALLRNNGQGSFAAPEFTTLLSGTDPAGIVARDFDGDGHVDVMVANSGTSGVRFLKNLGDGDFLSGAGVVVGSDPRNIDAADFDGDGDMDVAVTNRGDDTISFIRNLGGGAFTVAQTLGAGDSPRGFAFGRLTPVGTGGASMDVALVAHGARQVRVFRGLGDCTFSAHLTLDLVGLERPEALAIADVDNDGDDDLVVSLADTTVHDIGVFGQTAPGVFCPCDFFDVGGIHPVGVALGDFDFDSFVDAATVNSVTNDVSVLRNLGSAQFGELQTFPVLGPEAQCIVTGDLDGNHYLDFVVTNDLGNSVSVILNGRDNPSSYCQSSPNSAGAGAYMSWTGAPSIAGNAFTLEVSGAPAGVNGLFFLGQTPTETPYQSGYLCIHPPFARLSPTAMTSPGGMASRALDFGLWPASTIEPGSVWNMQFWYRDPSAAIGTTNFSDGLRVVFDL